MTTLEGLVLEYCHSKLSPDNTGSESLRLLMTEDCLGPASGIFTMNLCCRDSSTRDRDLPFISSNSSSVQMYDLIAIPTFRGSSSLQEMSFIEI